MDGKRIKLLFRLLYPFGRKYKCFCCFPAHLALWFIPVSVYVMWQEEAFKNQALKPMNLELWLKQI